MPAFNILISGNSVASDVDTSTSPIRVERGNTDRIGHATFTLSNVNGAYSLYHTSGHPTVEIAFNSATVFRGWIEKLEPRVNASIGSVATVHAYDYGQELLGLLSPDARVSGHVSIAAGTPWDQGYATSGGMQLKGIDAIQYTSGFNAFSGATVANFMSQWFGTETLPGGMSGLVASFKPYISGYTWQTWYRPDGSPDNNTNYYIPQLPVNKQYAFDVLRGMMREGKIKDTANSVAAPEMYIGMSGDINIILSGSVNLIASGADGIVSLIFYDATKSGSDLNNIIDASIPFDSIDVKNYIIASFPALTEFPIGEDAWSDLSAYSGALWSGINMGTATTSLSGNTAGPNAKGSMISIMAKSSGAGETPSRTEMIFTMPNGLSVNLWKWNTLGTGVKLKSKYRINATAGNLEDLSRAILIYDTSGEFMIKSGYGGSTGFSSMGKGRWNYIAGNKNNRWMDYEDAIFKPDGNFNSGDGFDGGWAFSTNFGSGSLTRINQIRIAGVKSQQVNGLEVYVDALHFAFNFNFSPVVGFNSGSIAMYGRRYDSFKHEYMMDEVEASGMLTHYLRSKLFQRAMCEVKVKDNPVRNASVQLGVNPGQVVIIDAPTMGTGSGQLFHYWRIIDVTHEYGSQTGFVTMFKGVPYFSGTLTALQANEIGYWITQGAYERKVPDWIATMLQLFGVVRVP